MEQPIRSQSHALSFQLGALILNADDFGPTMNERLNRLAMELRPFDRRASFELEMLAKRGEFERAHRLLVACRDGSIADALTDHAPRGNDESPSDLCLALEDLMNHLTRAIRDLNGACSAAGQGTDEE